MADTSPGLKGRIKRCKWPLIASILVLPLLLIFWIWMPQIQTTNTICVNTDQGLGRSEPKEAHKVLVIYSMLVPQNPSLNDLSLLNFHFFSSIGVLDDPDVEYLFIMASEKVEREQTNFEDPNHPVWPLIFPAWVRAKANVRFWWITNGQYDLCNYSKFFKSEWFESNFKRFSRYILINASVTGPLIHPMFASKVRWFDLLLERFDEHPDVAAVGPAIACLPGTPHVQTYVVAMDQRALQIANETWFCPPPNLRNNEGKRMGWIYQTEIGFSSNLVKHGYTFLSTLAATYHWNGADLLANVSTCTYRNINGAYNEWYPTPYDFLFFKSGGYVLQYQVVPKDMWKALQVATSASLLDAASRQLGPTPPFLKFPANPYPPAKPPSNTAPGKRR